MIAVPHAPGPGRLERVVVINDVATARGGATGLALLSIRLLRGAGIPVTVVVGDAGDNPELAELGVEVVALGGRHIAKTGPVNAMANGLYNAPARALLERWIEANDTPGMVYHVHGWSKILSPAIFGALAPVARRTVLHAHDFFLACPNGAFQDYKRGEVCLRVPLSRDCLSTNCDKRSYAQKLWRSGRQETLSLVLGRRFDETPILMIHDRMGEFFERSGISRERLRVLRNPVEPFTTVRVPAEHNSVFAFIGRIEAEKGIEDAAEAARRAGVALRVIGDGPDRAALETRYPEVEILGWSSREAIGALIGDTRALLMPSRYPEPFGLVAAEASRSGLPVILSQNAFLAQEFTKEGLGLGCDTRDLDAFAKAIRTLADKSVPDMREMSERAFSARVPVATTPDEWRDRLIDFYEERLMTSSSGRATARERPSADAVSPGPRVRLFNVKFSPNLGDGLLSEALENALRDEGCDERATYSVDMAARTGYGPGAVSRSAILKTLKGMPPALRHAAIRVPLEIMLRRRWRPHYETHLDGAEAVVIGGGNLFSDMDLNFPSKISAVLGLAAERNLPTAIYGVGVSGDWSPTGLAMLRRALVSAKPCYVSVRDSASKVHFDTFFAEAAGRRAEVVRDPGLLVSRHVEPPEASAERSRAIGLCITSAIAVRYHSSFQVTDAELSDWYVALCQRLREEGRPIVAFTNGSPEDEQFLDALIGRLEVAAGSGFSRRRAQTPTDLARLIAGLAALVAHRMHALIAAYSYGVPIFALRWDRKVDAFMESVGAGDRIAPATPDMLEFIAAAVHDLLAPRPQGEADRRRIVLDEAHADVQGLARALRQAVDAPQMRAVA